MALDPTVRQAARQVLQALHEFARDRGWKYARHADWGAGDYYIDLVVDVDWLRIYATFVAKEFKGQDGYERFELVQDYLRRKLADDPELIRAVVLVVMDPEQYATQGDFPPGISDERFEQEFVEQYVPHLRIPGP